MAHPAADPRIREIWRRSAIEYAKRPDAKPRWELHPRLWELRSPRHHQARLRGLVAANAASRKAALLRGYEQRTARQYAVLGASTRLPRYLRALRTELCVAEARQDWRFALLVLRVLGDVDNKGEPAGDWRPPGRKRRRTKGGN